MVEFDKKCGLYRLGLKVFRLGSVVSKSNGSRQAGGSAVWEPRGRDRRDLLPLVADGDQALCLHRFDGSHPVRVPFFESACVRRSIVGLRSESFWPPA